MAAGVWAAEQPLDKRLLDCPYDDVELLGKAVTRGDGWYPIGLAIHVWNGAVFGAVYSNVAEYLPVPRVLRGPMVALSEHLALWPLGSVSDRLHPARRQLPELRGNTRAFAQSTVRHVLFGVVLGELERRLNAAPEATPPPSQLDFSTNGHGSIERAVSGERI